MRAVPVGPVCSIKILNGRDQGCLKRLSRRSRRRFWVWCSPKTSGFGVQTQISGFESQISVLPEAVESTIDEMTTMKSKFRGGLEVKAH